MNNLNWALSRWTRLGAMFNVSPSEKTPDIEALLLDTARCIPDMPRLFAMSISWLARYHRLVCRHRLAALIQKIDDEQESATLGYLLSVTKQVAKIDHFNMAIKMCRPLLTPQPLYTVYRQNIALSDIAKQQSDPLACSWGLWAPPERLYDDAIQATEWIMTHNPSLKTRALFGGQLTASILVTLKTNPHAGVSESILSRTCRATRKAVRDALDHLELCRLIHRRQTGNSTRIVLQE